MLLFFVFFTSHKAAWLGERGAFYSLPAFLRAFFFWLRATVTILFLSFLALRSLNLSKSVIAALLALLTIRLLQALSAHCSSTLAAVISFLTILVGASKGKLIFKLVR